MRSKEKNRKPEPDDRITAAQFDAKFDASEDISEHLDLGAARVFAPGEERPEEADSRGARPNPQR
jgi:hypothetical protein